MKSIHADTKPSTVVDQWFALLSFLAKFLQEEKSNLTLDELLSE